MAPKKVLVVDDSPSVRQQVGFALGQAGFVVLEADSAKSAMRAIESQLPDAVICDVNMPEVSGLDMLEQLAASDIVPSLPVLMLTTEPRAGPMQRAKAAGARGWIVKPFKAELLVSAMQRLT